MLEFEALCVKMLVYFHLENLQKIAKNATNVIDVKL